MSTSTFPIVTEPPETEATASVRPSNPLVLPEIILTSVTPEATASISTSLTFPPAFTWGVATSSFQIEGASEADGKGLSIWDVYCRQEGAVADQSDGRVACDHYNRWAEDVDLLSDLNIGSYRFSIAWPRVVPDASGKVNQAGLDFYDRLVDGLLAKGIVPAPTLYHWDLPQWLGERNGWLNRDTAYAFAEYTEAVVARLGDRIPMWMTLNEPFCSAHLGYSMAEHAPGLSNELDALDASHHLMLAHGLGLERIRSLAPQAEAGIVLNFTPAVPETTSEADLAATQRVNDIENNWYSDALAGNGYPEATAKLVGWSGDVVQDGDLDIISKPIDVLGVNFYTRHVVSGIEDREPERPGARTDMGWEIHSPALGDLLRDLSNKYQYPKIMITENGCAMADSARTADGRVDDQDRIDYIDAHLAQVHQVIQEGVPVTGYYAWSLMDNFEWAFGYEKRFGIVEVDFETQERIPKRSALWYSDLIKQQSALSQQSPLSEANDTKGNQS